MSFFQWTDSIKYNTCKKQFAEFQSYWGPTAQGVTCKKWLKNTDHDCKETHRWYIKGLNCHKKKQDDSPKVHHNCKEM